MPNVDLQARLDGIKLQSAATFTAYKSSRDQLYNTIASANNEI
jgi:hypothetical protein